MRQRINLPAHRERLHLRGDHGQKPRQHVITKIRIAKRDSGGRAAVLLHPYSGEGSEKTLDVIVEREFVRMRAETYRIGFGAAFVVDECFDQLLSEHVALDQE